MIDKPTRIILELYKEGNLSLEKADILIEAIKWPAACYSYQPYIQTMPTGTGEDTSSPPWTTVTYNTNNEK